jgi:hypothetical protein
MKSFAALRLGGLALRRCRPDGAEMVLVSGATNMPRLTALWDGDADANPKRQIFIPFVVGIM